MSEEKLPQWAAVVQPGQTLIVGLAATENAEEYIELFRKARERLISDDIKVIFITGVTSLAIAEE